MENKIQKLSGISGLKSILESQIVTNNHKQLQPKLFKVIQKSEYCLYCGEKMESKTAKKRFCSHKCFVYHGREKARGTLLVPEVIEDHPKLRRVIKNPPEESYEVEDGVDILELQRRLALIYTEKIPHERDSHFGRKKWAADQKKKIAELENKIYEAKQNNKTA